MANQTSPSPDAPSQATTPSATTSPDSTSPGTKASQKRTSSKAKAQKAAEQKTAVPPALSPDQIEAQIAQTRAHLASTIDELAVRAQPGEIVRRQKESARAKLVEATHTPEGDLRVERLGAIAAAGAVVLIVLALLHRRHHDG
jgi:hypothetical protein